MKKTETAKIQREILAKNLNELLEKKRQSQSDVIKSLNLPEATVRSWFSGTKYPRIDKIQMLADYFNVPRSRITEELSNYQEKEFDKTPIEKEISKLKVQQSKLVDLYLMDQLSTDLLDEKTQELNDKIKNLEKSLKKVTTKVDVDIFTTSINNLLKQDLDLNQKRNLISNIVDSIEVINDEIYVRFIM